MRKWWRRFRCETLDWHTPDWHGGISGGFVPVSRCVHCGRKILADSNGDWFSVLEIKARCTATVQDDGVHRCILPDPPVHMNHRLKNGYMWTDIYFNPDQSWASRPEGK